MMEKLITLIKSKYMLDLVALGLTAYMLKDEMKFDASKLKISVTGLEVIKLGEGFSNTAYQIPGENQYTVGWGSTSVNHSNIRLGEKYSTSVLQKMLENDVKIREDVVRTRLQGLKITQGQFDALVSLHYNYGALFSRNSNFLTLLKAGKFEEARQEMDFWNTAGVKNGLIKRRMLEHCLFLGLPIPDKNTYDKVFTPRVAEFERTKSPELLKF